MEEGKSDKESSTKMLYVCVCVFVKGNLLGKVDRPKDLKHTKSILSQNSSHQIRI